MDFLLTDNPEHFRDKTAGRQHRLEPRRIDAGPHAGRYALPTRVLADPAFVRIAALQTLERVTFEPPEAWAD